MPTRCCVPGCSVSGGHKFPSNPELCLKWRVALKRSDPTKGLWKPGKHDIVCHQHFTVNDYKETLLGDRSRLKIDAVPSVFSFRPDINIVSPRTLRMQSRKATRVDKCTALDQGIQQEVEVESTHKSTTISIDSETDVTKNMEIQCELLGRYSIENFRDNPKAVSFYTGFKSYENFIFLFLAIGPAAYELTYKCSSLHSSDQLFITLIKLRCAKEDLELFLLFNLSVSTIGRIFNTWINFLCFQLKELNIWPSRGIVDKHMPVDFQRKFPSTRVILGATQIPIQKS
ncbi:unnamed protein product [Mytilus coruscus]|uniref:THAP-type domain-containing protein n=1 Tax=Mytilus coruscus TaxID=42192 RepID=A0A6J8DYB8_MYTCO|nr:unnamed protein product [Mytilus coruscus]